MPNTGPIPGSGKSPCDPPWKKPRVPKEKHSTEWVTRHQTLIQVNLVAVAQGVETLILTARARAVKPLGKCRVWSRKLCARVQERVQAGGQCAGSCLARLVETCRDQVENTCLAAGRCGRVCMARCIVRQEDEAGEPVQETVGSVAADVPRVIEWVAPESVQEIMTRPLTPAEVQAIADRIAAAPQGLPEDRKVYSQPGPGLSPAASKGPLIERF